MNSGEAARNQPAQPPRPKRRMSLSGPRDHAVQRTPGSRMSQTTATRPLQTNETWLSDNSEGMTYESAQNDVPQSTDRVMFAPGMTNYNASNSHLITDQHVYNQSHSNEPQAIGLIYNFMQAYPPLPNLQQNQHDHFASNAGYVPISVNQLPPAPVYNLPQVNPYIPQNLVTCNEYPKLNPCVYNDACLSDTWHVSRWRVTFWHHHR